LHAQDSLFVLEKKIRRIHCHDDHCKSYNSLARSNPSDQMMKFNSAAWYMQSRGIEHVRPAAHADNIAYTPAVSTLDDSWQNKESRLDHLQPVTIVN